MIPGSEEIIDLQTKQAVIFAILMQNGEGIIAKSFEYVWEKWKVIQTLKYPERLLDQKNTEIFNSWIKLWYKGRK